MAASTAVCGCNFVGKGVLYSTWSLTYDSNGREILMGCPRSKTSEKPHVRAERAAGYPISPFNAIKACCTARLVASPAAQDLREPVLGACRYVRKAPPSSHALESALM